MNTRSPPPCIGTRESLVSCAALCYETQLFDVTARRPVSANTNELSLKALELLPTKLDTTRAGRSYKGGLQQTITEELQIVAAVSVYTSTWRLIIVLSRIDFFFRARSGTSRAQTTSCTRNCAQRLRQDNEQRFAVQFPSSIARQKNYHFPFHVLD